MTAVVLFLVVFFGVPVVCWLGVRAARDMDARGRPGWLFGLLILTVFPIGVLAWLAVRSRRPQPDG